MLLRLNVEDFDCSIGPTFRNVTKQSGEVVNVRSYNSFSCSKYAIELQKQVNALCIDDICIPLLLCFAVWIDKAPLNSSMTRKATPVMIFLMNDKTRTPFRIGYAPDDFGNNQEMLESLLRKQKVSKSKSAIVDLVKEYKRQGLIDYVTSLFDQFLQDVWNSKGMDVQVGTGEKSAFFRVFPVLSHFITDNMQAVELCSVNDHHCRMCYGMAGCKDRTKFTFEHVPIANVVGPCFSIPAIDHVNHSFSSVGRHHARKEQTSYFYVLTPERTQLSSIFEYEDYLKCNMMRNPWAKEQGDAECLNFNFYLLDSEKEIVRDELNA